MKTSVNKYAFNIILLTLILFCNGTSFSNELKTDSLNNMLSKNLNSQTKIKVLLELGYLNSVSNNNNKALSNINEVFRLSIKSGKFYGDSIFSRLKKIVEIKLKNADSVSIKYIDIGIKEALNFKRLDFKWSFLLKKGSFLRIMGKSDASIKLFNELLLEIPKNDSVYKPFIYNNLAQSYMIKSDYQNALKNFLYARKLFTKVGNTKEEFACVNNIGGMYFMIEEYEKSIPFLIESLDYSKSIKDSLGICESYMNIGLVYTKLQKTDLAIINQTNAENILQYLNSPVTRAGNLCNLGMSFHQNKAYQKSEEVFLKAIKILEATSDLNFLSITYQSLGTLYLEQKKWQKARYYLKKSEQLVNKIGNIRTQMVLLNELFKLEKATNNFIMALEYLEKYSALKDSIFNSDKMKELSDINTKNAIEINEEKFKAIQLKKDILSQAEIRKQKIIKYYAIIGLVLVAIAMLFFYYQRNKIRKEKQRSEELLLNILPEEVADELKKKGSAEAQQIDEVTVLFTDFKGFTQLAEKLTPKELVAEINECFSAFDYIVEKYNVEKIKTIGDAYMAAGGLPTANNTHAKDVIYAALEIQLFMENFKAKKIAANELFFEIRIGIHTGPVVAGIVGVKKFAYDIWGDTVNTASRMESSGAVGKVNISGATFDLVKDLFKCEYRGKIKAKGKGEIDMYFVQ
jgi:class 3 adenylate cyclase